MTNWLRKAYEWVGEAFEFQNGAFSRVWSTASTASGKTVNEDTALQGVAVLRAATLIAGAYAMLPADVYRKSGATRANVDQHSLEDLLNRESNPEMDAMTFRAQMALSFVIWGNAYARKVRSSDGRLIALWPLHPGQVQVKRNEGGEIIFEYSFGNREPVTYRAADILHVPWFSKPGSLVGMSAIRQARESLGLGMSLQDHAAYTMRNRANPSLILKHPQKLGAEAHKRLQQSVEEKYSGAANAARPMILEEGMDVTQSMLNFRDLQFLEQMQFSDERVAMLMGVPPHMIGLVSKSTSWGTGIGEQKQGFMDFTLGPVVGFFERALNRQCFTATEKAKGLYLKHNLNAFLRADIEKRYAAYGVGVDKGWLDRNEVRAFEDLDPFDGGDVKTIQQQMIPLGMAGEHIKIAAAKQVSPTDDKPQGGE